MEAIVESALPWIIGTGVGGLLLGGWIGIVMGRSRGNEAEVERLTAELAQAETALETYRSEVYEEFAETAVRFKALNDSYTGLHQQLARSAAVLCGEPIANALLEGPEAQALGTDADDALAADAELEGAGTEAVDEHSGAVDPASDVEQGAEVDERTATTEDLGEILIQEADVASTPGGTDVPTLDEVVEELGEVAEDLKADIDYPADQPVKKTG